VREYTDVPTSKGNVRVCRLGDAGPPVVLLHGVPGSGRSWRTVSELLAAHCRVVVPDLIGFGGSARSADLDILHAEGQAGVLEEVFSRLRLGPAVVVGHDFGGAVALTFAGRRPDLVDGLALLATNAFADTPIPFPLSTVTWPLVGRGAARLLFSRPSLARMMRLGVGVPPGQLDVDAAVGDRGQRRAIALVFGATLTHLRHYYRPIEEGLARIAVPTLVGWGEHDPFFSVEQGRRTAAAVHDARFRLYPGAGHFLPEERPREVASHIAELASVAAARP
jgi:pimeloyl-ACP methyl ester carboxylesterase